MKISDVKTHVLSKPLDEPFQIWEGTTTHRSTLLIEVVTDEGVIGWGESVCHGRQPAQIAASFVEFFFKPLLLGRDPFDVEVLWEELFKLSRPFGGGAAVNALSGIDIALWDVIGRALNKPIHKLIGGAFRTEVVPYATGFYRMKGKTYPDASIAEAKGYMEKGIKAFKLKVGYGVKADLEYVYAIREALGPDVIIGLDANCAYDTASARRILLEGEEANIHFFEEPLRPDDIEGYKMLRNLTKTYLASGENTFGKLEYRHWITSGALDILQPDVCSAGGITECKKIVALAQAYNTMVIPHVWGTGVGLAAALQFLASIPTAQSSFNSNEEPLLEFDQSPHPFRDDLINDEIQMIDGKISVPTAPGLGVNINRDVVEQYKQKVFV